MKLANIHMCWFYFRYYRTQGQNNMLQLQWDKMKTEKKRLVKEQS